VIAGFDYPKGDDCSKEQKNLFGPCYGAVVAISLLLAIGIIKDEEERFCFLFLRLYKLRVSCCVVLKV